MPTLTEDAEQLLACAHRIATNSMDRNGAHAVVSACEALAKEIAALREMLQTALPFGDIPAGPDEKVTER
jgi:hypothetical protein